MKKLKTKVFWVILSILTIFVISILTIFNYQNYFSAKERIKQNLIKAESFNLNKKPNNRLPKPNEKNDVESMLFMDTTIYTILLDNNNNIIDIINNSYQNITNQEIETKALNIIGKNKTSRMYLGNIYFTKTAYLFHDGTFLIIADISDVNHELLSNLSISFFLFLMLECLIIFISSMITSWIIKPVKKAFDKQKQFIADASHELKTPLAVIMASSDALENNPEETKWLNNIKNESDHMHKLIQKLLELTRSENTTKETFTKTNISKLVELESLSLESLMFEQKITLEMHIESNIYMKASPEQIKELISILLDNAIKHSYKKGKIIVSLNKEKNNIILEIKNKGEAISKDDEEKIFERFYRADKSRNRTDGRYGLGLAIAKNIVTSHNGTITASSNQGYTTFKIIFKEKIF